MRCASTFRPCTERAVAVGSASAIAEGCADLRRAAKAHDAAPDHQFIARPFRRFHESSVAPLSQEAADGHNVSLRAAILVERDILDLANVLVGVVVDVEADHL